MSARHQLAKRLAAISLAASASACLSLGSADSKPGPDPGGGGAGGTTIQGGGGFPHNGGGGSSASGGTSGGGTGAGGGVGGTDGGPDGGSGGGCTPTSCAAQGMACGTIDNGCGAPLDCGECATGQACDFSNQCVGIAGTWNALSSACDGVQGAPDPTLSDVWTIAPGVLKVLISDADCIITDFGTIDYTPTTFTLTFNARSCAPEGCAVGQAGAICVSSSGTSFVISGTYTLPDAHHLQLQYPGGPGTGCASGQTQTGYFSR